MRNLQLNFLEDSNSGQVNKVEENQEKVEIKKSLKLNDGYGNYNANINIQNSLPVVKNNLGTDFNFAEKISSFNNLFNIKGLFETDSKIIFKVDKKVNDLKNIMIKYMGIDAEFSSVAHSVEKFDDSLFQLKHACNLLVTDEDVK